MGAYRIMMTILYTAPIMGVILSQVSGVPAGLGLYGPIGLVCLLLVYREEKTRAEMKEERDAVRKDNALLREEIRSVAHQMKNLNRNLLYTAATSGPDGIRHLAEKELERTNNTPK
jgi:hypothetical protein